MTKSSKDKGNRDWRKELRQLLDKHSGMPGRRGRVANHRSQKVRSDSLRRMFALLRQAGYMVGPSSLGAKHIEFLMQYWTADPRALEGLRMRHSMLAMLEAPYSPSYIQQQTSFLRTLCEWAGKPGLVLPARRYVSDPLLVSCAASGKATQAPSGKDNDRQAILSVVAQADPVVGLQLEVLIAFGLRARETVEFCPTLAEVPLHALPTGANQGDYLAVVRVKRGTPGGRVRMIPIRSAEQRAVFERARAVAPTPGTHIGRPGRSVAQARARFTNVLRRCGVSLRKLGVTPRWLKQEFADDIYLELRSLPRCERMAPLGKDPAFMDEIYQVVGRLLERRRTSARRNRI